MLAAIRRIDPWTLGLVACVVVFVAVKAGDVALPMFWDEMGGYGAAAFHLHDHTLGLLPRHVPPEISRGHPLLLAFVFGAIFRVFGATAFVAHAAMLVVSVALVVSLFHVGRMHFGAAVGFAAAVLLMVQPIFLAQSTMLLAEVPLALAVLWTVHAFCRRQHVVVALCGTAAVLVKETAIVVPFALGLVLVLRWARERPRAARAAAGVAALLVPALALGGFWLLQKQQNGWYFFPSHTRAVDVRWILVRGKLADYAWFLFVEQGRAVLSVAILLATTHRVLARADRRCPHTELDVAIVVVIATYVLFSAGNFFMKRYLLCLVPLLALVAAHALALLLHGERRALIGALVPVAAVQLAFVQSPVFHYDYDLSYRHQVHLQQETTRYLEQHVGTQAPVYANFPLVFGLEEPRFGYARSRFNVARAFRPEVAYILGAEFTTVFGPPSSAKTELVRTFASPYMKVKLYRVLR